MSGRRAFCAASVGIAAIAVAFLLGFVHFASRVTTFSDPGTERADGIVALTGGASRIADALELLAEQRGQRLLITGVHPTTTDRAIAERIPGRAELFDCCVDLDYDALNTVGNAEETRKWAEQRGFRSLIVVTSGYHIPRSMAELGRAMPDIALIPYPVLSDTIKNGSWWADKRTAKLLLQEYVKYVVALARQSLSPGSAQLSVAQAARARVQ